MSEKRYIFECDGNNCLIFENDVWLKIEEVVDLLNSLYEENEQLKERVIVLEKLISDVETSEGMSIDNLIDIEMIGDEPFEFNKNCAKPYEIRSVSPNGVVRVGKKNSKVSWRMKDVREIYKELPPFEDFNHETLQGIRNKFHTKFDNDVIGRIIYNIYIGTFEEYI